jgi:hypothetical protein
MPFGGKRIIEPFLDDLFPKEDTGAVIAHANAPAGHGVT